MERELFGSRAGFVLAAVGSAIGLGNMWRFPYITTEGGGAAFVVLYVAMVFLIGVPVMLAEFAVGRRTRKSPIGAFRSAGGGGWPLLGVLAVISGLLILSYFSVIAGWTIRYAWEAIVTGFPADPGGRFQEVASGSKAIAYHVLFMTVTTAIVIRGVKRGIELASRVLMPLLFFLLIGLALWAATLEGSGAGYAFYLRPSVEALLDPTVVQLALGQALLSLSLGMGAMITYSSYLSREENLSQEAAVISLADFSVAFVAGLVVFPVIFALGFQQEVGESVIGTLFISLPGAFLEMGSVGRAVGILFFVTLIVAQITSAVSLLEVVTASFMDEVRLRRGPATLLGGAIITGAGVFPALYPEVLAIFDKFAGELFLVAGGLGMAVFVGWVMENPQQELSTGSSPALARLLPGVIFLLRWVIPPAVAWILWYSLRSTWSLLFGGG